MSMALRIDTPWLTSTLDERPSYDRNFSVLKYGKPVCPESKEIQPSNPVILKFPKRDSGYYIAVSENSENPFRFTDPDGKEDFGSALLQLAEYTSGASKVYLQAFAGDHSSQEMIAASIPIAAKQVTTDTLLFMRDTGNKLDEAGDYGVIVGAITMQPEVVGFSESVSKLGTTLSIGSNMALAVMTGDTNFAKEALSKVLGTTAGALVNTRIKNSMASVEITIGKNGHFFQKGYSGSMKNFNGIVGKILQDLTPVLGDQGAKKVVEEITKGITNTNTQE